MSSGSTVSSKKAVSSVFWTYSAYYSGKLLVFISTVILARILSQGDFGVAGYALTVISFLDVLSDLGIGPALIYHRDEPGAADSAFWLGLLISIALFFFTWLCAPFAGLFFQDPQAIPVTRALAFTFPLSALGNIHDFLLRKELSFKRKFIPDLARSVGKGIFSISAALMGFGAWSLIIGQLAGTLSGTIFLWIIYPYRPSFRVVRETSRALLNYGLHIVAVDSLGILLQNSDYLLVGRYLGAVALGVYSLAFRIPDLLILQFCWLISGVVFPLYSKVRDDPAVLVQGFLTTLRYVALVTVPLGFGVALVADPLIRTFFSDKWVDAIPVLRAIAIYALMLSLSFNAGDIYKAKGQPNIITRLSFGRLVVLLPGLFWASNIAKSIVMVGYVQVVVAFIFGIIGLYIAGVLLETPFKDVLKALRPALVSGFIMSLVVVASLELHLPNLYQLIVSVALGASIYLGVLLKFDPALIQEVKNIISQYQVSKVARSDTG